MLGAILPEAAKIRILAVFVYIDFRLFIRSQQSLGNRKVCFDIHLFWFYLIRNIADNEQFINIQCSIKNIILVKTYKICTCNIYAAVFQNILLVCNVSNIYRFIISAVLMLCRALYFINSPTPVFFF